MKTETDSVACWTELENVGEDGCLLPLTKGQNVQSQWW